ncbi:MAG: 30S ribosomal protein S18 [Clostridia bacterium]|nr:30S ribosomal protein S18 [Clostridia bacterium]
METRERTERPERSERPRNDRRRRKICQFCADKMKTIDYKDTSKLRKYVSDRGKILPRRLTGTCAAHQRQLTEAVKRARHVALLPYTAE